MITPDAAAYSEDDEDFKIRFWEATKYAREYTITIDKKQNFKNDNLCIVDTSMNGMYWSVQDGNLEKFVKIKNDSYTSSNFIDVSKYDKIKIYVPVESNVSHTVYFVSDSKTTALNYFVLMDILQPVLKDGYRIFTLSVHKDAKFAVVPLSLECANDYIVTAA